MGQQNKEIRRIVFDAKDNKKAKEANVVERNGTVAIFFSVPT